MSDYKSGITDRFSSFCFKGVSCLLSFSNVYANGFTIKDLYIILINKKKLFSYFFVAKRQKTVDSYPFVLQYLFKTQYHEKFN